MEFLGIAQCGSYITEDPGKADEMLRNMDVRAMESRFGSYDRLPDTFKEKLAAQTVFGRQTGNGGNTPGTH